MKNLVWFRNDLRVHDNPALSSACSADNEVVAVYIVSEPQWKEHNDSVNKISFWFRCLSELEKELNKINIPLIISKMPKPVFILMPLTTRQYTKGLVPQEVIRT